MNIMIREFNEKLLLKVPCSNNTISKRIIIIISTFKRILIAVHEATNNNIDTHSPMIKISLFCKNITAGGKDQD